MVINDKNEPVTAIVADDNIDTLDLLCEYLEMDRFRIVGKTYNGKEVLKLYLKFKPDVVFLDVMMEYYDGIYTLEQIRKVNPDAIVIMVTADLSKKTAEKLARLHATCVIPKPFDLKNMASIVKKLVISQRNNKPNLKQSELLVQHPNSTFYSHPQEAV